MPKSKNRKDHAKKVAARNQRINEVTNMKKKQVTAWLQQMQMQAQAQAQTASENVLDVASVPSEITVQDVVEEISKDVIGESGKL